MNDDIPVLDRLRTQLLTAIDREQASGPAPVRSRRRLVAVAGGVALVLGVAGVAVTLARDPAPDRDIPRVVAPSNGAPESPIGGSVGSCVEQFSVENLGNRQFAFDGVIREILVPDGEGVDPTLVTFEVTHWYTGGSGDRVQLKTWERPGGITSASLGQADAVQLEGGQRVLASGEEDFLWSCGFSMLYTPNNAALFAAAFE